MDGCDHQSVKHCVGDYVDENIHNTGMESFWSVLKRSLKGTFNKINHKHFDWYVTEFAGRHKTRPQDTIEQMKFIAQGMFGKQITYGHLIS